VCSKHCLAVRSAVVSLISRFLSAAKNEYEKRCTVSSSIMQFRYFVAIFTEMHCYQRLQRAVMSYGWESDSSLWERSGLVCSQHLSLELLAQDQWNGDEYHPIDPLRAWEVLYTLQCSMAKVEQNLAKLYASCSVK